MSDSLDSLPWASLPLNQPDIPWDDLRTLADAAARDADVRKRLIEALDRAVSDQEVVDAADNQDFTDLAVPAIFALAAEKLDRQGRREAAECLIRNLYEAGRTNNDFHLEIMMNAAQALGNAVAEPALVLLKRHGKNMDCWFHLMGTLTPAASKFDDYERRRLIEICRKFVWKGSERFSRWSPCHAAAHLLAVLGDTASLPHLREIYKVSHSEDVQMAIDFLTRKKNRLEAEFALDRVNPVEEWLPHQVRQLREWLNRSPTGDTAEDEVEQDAMPYAEDAEEDGDEIETPDWAKQSPVGRNDPCPCGSMKKYKKCCGRKQDEAQSETSFL